jgi:hypothetical protein
LSACSDKVESPQVDVNVVVKDFAALIANCVLDDNLWKIFGFNKRPVRGSYFDIFISKQKLKWERHASLEIIIMALTDVIIAMEKALQDHKYYAKKPAILIGILEILFSVKIWKLSPELIAQLEEGITSYRKAVRKNRHIILFDRCINAVPKEHQGSVMIRAISYFVGTIYDGLVLNRNLLNEFLISKGEIVGKVTLSKSIGEAGYVIKMASRIFGLS